MRVRTSILVALLGIAALLAAACIRKASDEAPSGEEPAATSAADRPEGSGAPGRAAVVAEEALLLINEVGPAPVPGEAPFVELKNAGGTPADLSRVSLGGESGPPRELPSPPETLPPGGILLVRLDGDAGGDAGPAVVHLPNEGLLGDSSDGVVRLTDQEGQVLDRVAWGPDRPRGVRLGRGGVARPLRAGETIGRHPRSASPRDRLEWVTYLPDQASPGAPNPIPRVEILLPPEGASVASGAVPLGWYTVPGVSGYRVQVIDRGGDFSSPRLDETVEVPPLTVEMPPGAYSWRVQAIGPEESASGFSRPRSLRVEPGAEAAAPAPGRLLASPWAPWLQLDGGVEAMETLDVPIKEQRKDTSMLLMESDREDGDHAWDRPHPEYNPYDGADKSNCALASVSMVVAFFGGDLSQDRIGYQILHDREEGPETDLMYERGLYDDEITEALTFAFGGAEPTFRNLVSADGVRTFWEDLTTQIDQGRPVVAAIPGHAWVAAGYRISRSDDGDRIYEYRALDPTWGRAQWVELDIPAGVDPAGPAGNWSPDQGVDDDPLTDYPGDQREDINEYWILPESAQPVSDEPGIHSDCDGDGVSDFDETERFETDPADPDTDLDGVEDKEEIRASVFDILFGYANSDDTLGRDWDRDDLPIEIDPDADDGGCDDGMEDTDGDGVWDQDETHNFDDTDDEGCWELSIRSDWEDEWGTNQGAWAGQFTVDGDGEVSGTLRGYMNHEGCLLIDVPSEVGIGGSREGDVFRFRITGVESRLGSGVEFCGKLVEEPEDGGEGTGTVRCDNPFRGFLEVLSLLSGEGWYHEEFELPAEDGAEISKPGPLGGTFSVRLSAES